MGVRMQPIRSLDTIRDLEMMIDRYARLVDQINTQTKSTGGHIVSDDMANIMDTPKK